MRMLASVAAIAAFACLPTAAFAKVHISVDLDRQVMHVESQDQTYDWKVSSGASGYDTPPGTYSVLWMDKDHKSDEYDGAPMPNAIFFKPGFAIHGAYKSDWGHPASHGCIRLPVAKSAILWDLVKAEGGAEIKVTGGSPTPPATTEARAPRHAPADDAYEASVRDADGYGGYYDGYSDRTRPQYREPAPAYESRPAANPLDQLFSGGF